MMLTRLLRMLSRDRSRSAVAVPPGAAGSPDDQRRGVPGMSGIMAGQRGFSLVELLIAILVMTISLFAMLGLQTFAMQANSVAQQLSVGSSLAQQVLEDIMALPIDNQSVNTTNTSTTSPYVYGAVNFATQDGGFPVSPATNPPTYTTFKVDPSGERYTATYTTLVGNATNGVPTGVSRITVTVNYTYKGNAKSVTMTGFKRTV